MKRLVFFLLLAATLLAGTHAQTKGPTVDKILFNAKSQEDIGLMDVAGGKSDIWNYATSGGVYKRLPETVKSKLDTYSVSGASFLGLYLNPYPDKAPYLSDANTDASGKVRFNPLAMRKIRHALNWLVDRQKIVDEILSGAGLPMFTPVVPGLPNSSRFDLVAAKLGMTASGNEVRALADIDAAMREAAALPELRGRLAKASPWWSLDGAPVTVRFVMRADDPSVRLPLGRYVADQIEKAGIKVERVEVDRVKAHALYAETDPRANQWNIYTEGLGSNQTNAYWETVLSQMYAPWASVMPGGNNRDFWNYENPELDRLTSAAVNGQFKDEAEYWSEVQAAASLGMRESVRILLAAKTSYLAAATDRFDRKMAYGLADGIDKWSMYTADVKAETSGADSGKKVLRMTGFSARGALFMSAWDPVGPDGFGDTYSGIVMKEVSDLEMESHPASGIMMGVRATWSAMASSPEKTQVPPQAVIWNADNQKWESGLTYTKDSAGAYAYQKTANLKARSRATFSFLFGNWHHGRPVDTNDYRYAIALRYDLSHARSADDRVYNQSYASAVNPSLARQLGYSFNPDKTITVYGDANFPMDKAQLASLLVPSLQVGAVNSGAVLPWEILESLKAIVAESSASGTAYSFSSDNRFTEVDLLARKTVQDLKAKLAEFIATKRVPASLAGFLTADEAVRGYRLTLAWLESHGHGYISNGGFLLDRYDPVANTGVLVANRDPAYPFAAGYWDKALRLDYSRIDALAAADYRKGQSIKVTATVVRVAYPENSSGPADKADVYVSLITGDREIRVKALAAGVGTYTAEIPASVLDGLEPGLYTVVAESNLGKEQAPGVGSTKILKY